MDDILVEKVLNNEMTQDEAVEEAYNPEYVLRVLNIRRSMRYCLKVGLLARQLAKLNESIENYKLFYEYLDISQTLLHAYSENIYRYTFTDINSNSEYSYNPLNNISPHYNNTTQNQNKFQYQSTIYNYRTTEIVTDDLLYIFDKNTKNKYSTLIENTTELILEKSYATKGYSYASIFQGLSEIVDYLAGALGG